VENKVIKEIQTYFKGAKIEKVQTYFQGAMVESNIISSTIIHEHT
jgi:hypothetical protein